MQGIVAAADTTRPDDRSRAHTGICVHHVAMMSSLSGQSGRSGESEDSKTDNNASGHSRSSSVIPPQGAHVNYSATWHSSHHTFPRALAPESTCRGLGVYFPGGLYAARSLLAFCRTSFTSSCVHRRVRVAL